MRRLVLVVTLIAVCGLFAAPASAQVGNHDWFAHAAIGPSFGTLGSTPVADASAGYKMTNHLSVAGEFGVLPHAPFDKAGVIAPTITSFAASSDVHVNAYHTNANLFVHASPWRRFDPYATVGVGAFTGSTAAGPPPPGAHAPLPASRVVQYRRETNLAENFGVGTTYRLTNWLGLNADYRHFVVNA